MNGYFQGSILNGWCESSGKSTVVDGLGLKALGLKLVNTDKSFETGLKKVDAKL